ncbi:MAG TPA: polysaccharide deacetylase family protein [Longimicrobium sp.]|jgi:peptidoglycan/xylan/chitin deacetylase (PgdA/CDA1 family)
MPEAAATRLRSALKHAAERTLARSGVGRLALALRRAGVLVLAWHDVVPAGQAARGDGSLHLPQEAFGRQLDALGRTHRVVTLDQALAPPPPGGTRPRAVVTFDDAYLGAVTAGVAELARRGLPATVFVAPGLLGTVPWWDALAGDAGLDPAVRAHALGPLGGRRDAVLAWAEKEGMPIAGGTDIPRIATEDELARAAAQEGIALAPHGWSHASLPTLAADELEAEMTRPLAWLRARFANVTPWLAYPYGHASPAVEAAAERAGYRGALRVEGGWMTSADVGPRRFSIPRFNVPAGLSDDGFRLRISGVRG